MKSRYVTELKYRENGRNVNESITEGRKNSEKQKICV